eukprot:1444506-Pleurochrysis_carterae.AAC.1
MCASRLSQPRSDIAGAHCNGMCAPVHANDPRDAQPVTAAAALAYEGTLACHNQAADADCLHGCCVWCASEARLQAAMKIGSPCSCLRLAAQQAPHHMHTDEKGCESYDLASAQHGHQHARFPAMFAWAKKSVTTCM